jgi:hypothetical protein
VLDVYEVRVVRAPKELAAIELRRGVERVAQEFVRVLLAQSRNPCCLDDVVDLNSHGVGGGRDELQDVGEQEWLRGETEVTKEL